MNHRDKHIKKGREGSLHLCRKWQRAEKAKVLLHSYILWELAALPLEKQMFPVTISLKSKVSPLSVSLCLKLCFFFLREVRGAE